MNEHPDPYVVLGVTPTATPAEITHAFRAKLRTLHPDTRSAAIGDGQLRQVLAAYGLLRDPNRRADYDRTANLAPAPPPPRRSGPSAPTAHPCESSWASSDHGHIPPQRQPGAARATPIVGRAGAQTPLTAPSQAAPMQRCSALCRADNVALRRRVCEEDGLG